ncbi:hypothetical protein BS17DRAFT_790695 [Gyrodon lividus]|nr:hypothetical protein BS17DRAFT_790695 [Gyrodon lividus]
MTQQPKSLESDWLSTPSRPDIDPALSTSPSQPPDAPTSVPPSQHDHTTLLRSTASPHHNDITPPSPISPTSTMPSSSPSSNLQTTTKIAHSIFSSV